MPASTRSVPSTTTPAGKAMFQMVGVFAEFERDHPRARGGRHGAGQGQGQGHQERQADRSAGNPSRAACGHPRCLRSRRSWPASRCRTVSVLVSRPFAVASVDVRPSPSFLPPRNRQRRSSMRSSPHPPMSNTLAPTKTQHEFDPVGGRVPAIGSKRLQNETEGPRGLRILGVTIGGEVGGFVRFSELRGRRAAVLSVFGLLAEGPASIPAGRRRAAGVPAAWTRERVSGHFRYVGRRSSQPS